MYTLLKNQFVKKFVVIGDREFLDFLVLCYRRGSSAGQKNRVLSLGFCLKLELRTSQRLEPSDQIMKSIPPQYILFQIHAFDGRLYLHVVRIDIAVNLRSV